MRDMAEILSRLLRSGKWLLAAGRRFPMPLSQHDVTSGRFGFQLLVPGRLARPLKQLKQNLPPADLGLKHARGTRAMGRKEQAMTNDDLSAATGLYP
jgi:hypothetical protein